MSIEMKKILIVVYVEPEFDLTGDLEILAKQIVLYSNNFDRIINIKYGFDKFNCIHKNFKDTREWLYDINFEAYPEGAWIEGDNYISTSGHDYSEILSWMKELPRDAEYTLVGGQREWCLQDIYDIWCYLGYKCYIHELLTY